MFVKHFECFPTSFELPCMTDKQATLDVITGDRWKNMRKGLSPNFSSGKLKKMMEPMAGVADRFMSHIDRMSEETGRKPLSLKYPIQGLALDTISTCGFGIQTDAISDPNQEIIKQGRAAFAAFAPTSWSETLSFSIPFSYLHFMTKYLPIFPEAFDNIWAITDSVMKAREKQGITGTDFVGRLMELIKDVERDPNAPNHKDLSRGIIVAQGTFFFAAGFETPSIGLCTLLYHFAKHLDIQQRCYDEVSEAVEETGGVVNHETAEKLEYLEAAIHETMRIFPPVLFVQRRCVKECEIAPGLICKPGMIVDMPIYPSHHEHEFFPEPARFDPDRFLKDNAKGIIPHTYRPFGGGPRQCIGSRFAITLMKVASAKLLTRYRIVEVPGETELKFRKGNLIFIDFEDIVVRLEKRQ